MGEFSRRNSELRQRITTAIVIGTTLVPVALGGYIYLETAAQDRATEERKATLPNCEDINHAATNAKVPNAFEDGMHALQVIATRYNRVIKAAEHSYQTHVTAEDFIVHNGDTGEACLLQDGEIQEPFAVG